MAREVRAWLAAAAMLACIAGSATAQPHTPTTEIDPWDLLAAPNDRDLAPPAEGHFEDDNGDILQGDPFLDPSRFPAPGLFAGVQTSILKPSFNNRLAATVTVAGMPAVIILPTASLEWTVAPEFRVGYRFAEGFGAVALTYRFLMDEGSGTLAGFDAGGSALLRSRLNVNVVDLDYMTREFGLAPRWDLRWTIGARIITNYFDTRAVGTFLQDRASSNHVAGGPHLGMELWRWLSPQPGHGLALYGKTDAAFTYGRVDQDFERNVLVGGVPVAGGATILSTDPGSAPGNGNSQYLPIVRAQLGMTWAPDWRARQVRFSSGYEFEGWWWVGRVPGPVSGASGSTLTTNGVFLRAEWKY